MPFGRNPERDDVGQWVGNESREEDGQPDYFQRIQKSLVDGAIGGEPDVIVQTQRAIGGAAGPSVQAGQNHHDHGCCKQDKRHQQGWAHKDPALPASLV